MIACYIDISSREALVSPCSDVQMRIPLDDIAPAIVALSNEYNDDNVKVFGASDYCLAYANSIKDYSLKNYKENKLNVEVLN